VRKQVETPKSNFTFLNNFKIQPFSQRPSVSQAKASKNTVSISTSALKDFEINGQTPPGSAPQKNQGNTNQTREVACEITQSG
jgi:hypothetical protein